MSASLHYCVDGPDEGLPVVLLHPIATDLRIWSPLVPILASRCRVIRMDLAGHGGSGEIRASDVAEHARLVVRVMTDLGLSKAAIVGLSLGGMVAQRIALDFPGHVSALVLACTGAKTSPEVAALWHERIAAARAGGMQSQIEPTLARWFTPAFAAAAPATLAWVRQIIGETPVEGYIDACNAIRGLDQLDELHNITAPTLVIAGTEDKALPLTVAEAIAGSIPRARMVQLAAAHLASVEQPIAFLENAAAFLAHDIGKVPE